MTVAALVCLGMAVLIGGSGLWTMTRPAPADLTGQVVRAVAPTQLAAGVMLVAAGLVAWAAPSPIAVIGLIVGVFGATAVLVAGSWQSARYVERKQAAGGGGCGSGDGCGGCAKVCGS